MVGLHVSNGGESRNGHRNPCGLVPFSAVWNGGKIRRIGFDEQTVLRHQPDNIVAIPVPERDDAAERYVPSCIECYSRERWRPGEAVQYAFDAGLPCLTDHRRSVVFCVAGVHYDRKPVPLGERKLLREGAPLEIAW